MKICGAMGMTLGLVVLVSPGCGDSGSGSGGNGGAGLAQTGGSPEQTGSQCETAEDCYPDVAVGDLVGDAKCDDRVKGGYCTHSCNTDEDCCAAQGECISDLPQVCSPFENSDEKTCFLSCEDDDVGDEDPGAFCQREVGPSFICRSSGGGSENRKICVPGDCGSGASCSGDADCSDGLTCLADFNGGYCGADACTTNSDCGNDACASSHSLAAATVSRRAAWTVTVRSAETPRFPPAAARMRTLPRMGPRAASAFRTNVDALRSVNLAARSRRGLAFARGR